MTKFKKLLRNLALILILVFLFMRTLALSLTPMAAFKKAERSLHYGPSEIVHIEDIDEGKLILGKYDRWISCFSIERQWLFFWAAGSNSLGIEVDKSKILNYNLGLAKVSYFLYGIINDDRVDRVEITLANGEVYSQSDFHEDFFLINWKPDDIYQNWGRMIVKAYDDSDNVIFEEEY